MRKGINQSVQAAHEYGKKWVEIRKARTLSRSRPFDRNIISINPSISFWRYSINPKVSNLDSESLAQKFEPN